MQYTLEKYRKPYYEKNYATNKNELHYEDGIIDACMDLCNASWPNCRNVINLSIIMHHKNRVNREKIQVSFHKQNGE